MTNVVEGSTASGFVEPGFEGVREAFERNFADHGEVGAAVAVYVQGRKVVDIQGGAADEDGTPYDESTLQLVFSTTKGITAICANLLAQRGELDIDAPVAEYWPEFAAAGKDQIPVRYLLSHRVGLPYIEAPLTLEQLLAWDPAVEALASQAPIWEPGSAHGYHAVTYGWLVGEVIRRVSGKSVGRFVADELAGPLGLDMWVGLPDELQSKVAPLTNRGPGGDVSGDPLGGRDLAETIAQFMGPDALLLKALDGAPGVLTQEGVFNRPEVRAAEIPAANGVTNARSLAKLYAAVIGGVDGATDGPLLGPDQTQAALEVQTSGNDQVLVFETQFGLGFMRSCAFSPYGGPLGFGHSGAGGSMAFADPDAGVAFGYVMNRMLANLAGDPRTTGLVKAVYDAIGIEPAFA